MDHSHSRSKSTSAIKIRPWQVSNKFYSNSKEKTLWADLPNLVTNPLGLKKERRTSRACHPYGSDVWDLWSHEQEMRDPNNMFMVALSGGLVVGILLFKLHLLGRHSQGLYLEALCVEPEFRSKGVADRLLTAGIKAAHARYGAQPILLHATQGTVSLYRRHGFSVLSENDAAGYGMNTSEETPMEHV